VIDLNQARVFVEVVRAGGFAAAGRRLGLPKSTMSARVQALEARLGAQLLKRSTRHVALTEEGRAYYDSVAPAIDILVDAEAATEAGEGVLSGTIRFTAPLEFPREPLTLALATFAERHPMVRFDVILTNQPLDLVEENIDLALRGGRPGGAGLIVRKVGQVAWGLFASPGYLAQRGMPAAFEALADHELLLFSSGSASRILRGADLFEGLVPRIAADNLALLRRLAILDRGIAPFPITFVARDLAAGRLVPVLEEWHGDTSPLYIVFPSRRAMTPRVHAFADHLAEALGEQSSITMDA
jgi:DNA-binding transcriptional LysR family regulator